jgi:hypothetical protein
MIVEERLVGNIENPKGWHRLLCHAFGVYGCCLADGFYNPALPILFANLRFGIIEALYLKAF